MGPIGGVLCLVVLRCVMLCCLVACYVALSGVARVSLSCFGCVLNGVLRCV